MPERKGEYFADKKEAIEYYKAHEKNLEDKPDWLIECIIDFAMQYPNYKEYCEVEARIKNGQELTQKQKKKYGNLKWDRDTVDYKDGQILNDTVDIKEKGEYEDLARDPKAFEKYNKYGLEAGVSLPPDEVVKIRMEQKDGSVVEAKAKVQDIQKGGACAENKDHFTFETVEEEKTLEN